MKKLASLLTINGLVPTYGIQSLADTTELMIDSLR